MSITLQNNARNAAATAVGTLLNGGKLVFLTSGDAVVAVLEFAGTAFGAPDEGVITANAIMADDDTSAGTVARYEARTSADALVLGGTVTTVGNGGDVELTSLTFAEGETLEITGYTLTMPATA